MLILFCEGESSGEEQREGDTASEAGSSLRAVSTEPDMGLQPMDRRPRDQDLS